MTETGAFTISLDTELAWGSFDKDGVARFGDAYRRTPAVVERLCEAFDRYEIPATWAFVAHLFDDCAQHDRSGEPTASDEGIDPDRKRWLDEAPCATGVDRSLWYAPDLLETVENCSTPQEVGLHGYSHLVFADHSRAAARAELTAAVSAAEAVGLDPSSFVYPRNAVAHTDLLSDFGLDVYRGVDARWYERRLPAPGRKTLRFLDEGTRRRPPVVRPVDREGAVCVPGSQVFRPDRGAWAWTPGDSQVARARKGLDEAAKTGGIFHLWLHPFNLAPEVDHHLSLLDDVLAHAAELESEDELECLSLSAVAQAYRNGRWNGGHDVAGAVS